MWTFEKWKESYCENRDAYLMIGARNSWKIHRGKFVKELIAHFPRTPEALECNFGGVAGFVEFLHKDYDLIRCLGRPLSDLLPKLRESQEKAAVVREIEEVLDGYIPVEQSQ